MLKKLKEILYTFFRLTFKEDVPDCRNSKSLDLVFNLKKKGYKITFFDPYIEKSKGLKNLEFSNVKKALFDCIILSVPHKLILKSFKKITTTFET